MIKQIKIDDTPLELMEPSKRDEICKKYYGISYDELQKEFAEKKKN